MSENKVRFGLKNVHYAILTEGSSNSWDTPVAVPGAVSLSLDSNVASEPFYADNVTYYQTFANNGYTGTLEMARIPEGMLSDIWGIAADADGVIREYSNVRPNPFALLFQVDGDADQELYLLYRCVPSSKPSPGSQTTEDTATPQTQSFDISALPLVTGADEQQGLIKAHAGSSASTAIREAWFSAVNVPTPESE